MKKIDKLLETTMQYYSNAMVESMNKSLFADGFIKPVKFWNEPIFTIKIPYPYIDTEYDSEYGEGRKGLFIGIWEINIGNKKIVNNNYKEEYKRWKKQSNKTITWSRYTPLKVKLPKQG